MVNHKTERNVCCRKTINGTAKIIPKKKMVCEIIIRLETLL